MTQEAKPLQFAGAQANPQPSNPAQPAESSAQEGQAQADNTPKFLTEEAARQLFDSLFLSKGQQIAAKTEGRVRKVLEAAQAQGVTMTAQQAQQIIATADTEAQQAQPQQQVQAQPQAQPAQQQPSTPARQEQPQAVHPVIAVAQQMMSEAGITLEDSDPENSLVDQKTTNPAVFLASIQAAIDAKARRQAAAGTPARIPSLGGNGRPANPVSTIKDTNELWKLARQSGK